METTASTQQDFTEICETAVNVAFRKMEIGLCPSRFDNRDDMFQAAYVRCLEVATKHDTPKPTGYYVSAAIRAAIDEYRFCRWARKRHDPVVQIEGYSFESERVEYQGHEPCSPSKFKLCSLARMLYSSRKETGARAWRCSLRDAKIIILVERKYNNNEIGESLGCTGAYIRYIRGRMRGRLQRVLEGR